MSPEDKAVLDKLAEPIPAHEIKERQGGGGRMLRYIQAPTVIRRLDEATGGLWSSSVEMADGWAKCTITITLPSGLMLSRDGIGGYPPESNRLDDEDRVKGAESDAFKRAGVKFSIGIDLYADDTPASYGPPPRSVPEGDRRPPQGQRPQTPRHGGGNGNGGGQYPAVPRSGKALFAWVKEQEQTHDIGLLKYLNNWAKMQEFPGRMIDWDAEQVALAHSEAMRKLQQHFDAKGATVPPDDEDDIKF